MDIKEEISSFKSMINIYKLTNLTIPANIKHWHGAKKDSWFSHLAVEVPGENTSTEWCEKVINEGYEKLGDK